MEGLLLKVHIFTEPSIHVDASYQASVHMAKIF
jgi:hypothetical protein